MAFQRNAGFTSAIATDPAATAAGYLTPTRYNLAHVVSGATSGGIPFFSSTTAEGSSALLTAISPILGGGSGAAPYTDSGFTGSGTGVTFSVVIGNSITVGNGTVSAPSIVVGNSGGGIYTNNGAVVVCDGSAEICTFDLNRSGPQIRSDFGYMFCGSTTPSSAAADGGISRLAAASLAIGNGTPGSTAGSLSMNNCKAVSYTVGTTNGASFGPGVVTSLTVVNGIVTAVS